MIMRRLFLTAGLALILAAAVGPTASSGTDPGVADTIWFSPVAWNGDTAFSMTMYTATDQQLKHATIILKWNSTGIGIDSVSLAGSRWAAQVGGINGFFVADTGRVGGVKSPTRYNIAFLPLTTQLATGSGPVCRIFWKRTGPIVTDPIIVVDSSTTTNGTNVINSTLFGNSPYPAGNFIPVFKPDTIRVSPCICDRQGDINGDLVIDVFDVIALIGVAFSGNPDVQDPYCPITRGDVNHDNATDVFDVIYLIATAFSGGDSPISPCGL
jgi:hypothetical protein